MAASGMSKRSIAGCDKVIHAINRKKKLDDDLLVTELHRCLGLTDLILLGIGYMVGNGIFIITGEVVRHKAGSATFISYILSGVAVTLSALCYAELASLVPLAGSAYTYTYVLVGEFWAFLVGWNMIFEYLVSTASTAKAWSGTLDSLFNKTISRGIEHYIGSFHVPWMSQYPDFLALLIIIIITIIVAAGVKTSSNFNKVFVSFKLATIAIIAIAGFTLVQVGNMTVSGGFAPYGISGVFAGAATSYYAYIGFDGLVAASEEAINPRKVIPHSLIISVVIVIGLYILSSLVLTLMVPYYQVSTTAPFTNAFNDMGLHWAHYVVSLGTLFGLTTVLHAALFILPRILYSMANDGLIFKKFSEINHKTQTPIFVIVLQGAITGLASFLFDLDVLVSLLSLGTLFTFTLLSACIILLRYSDPILTFGDDYVITHSRHPSLIGNKSEEMPLKDQVLDTKNYDSITTNNQENDTEESCCGKRGNRCCKSTCSECSQACLCSATSVIVPYLNKYRKRPIVVISLVLMICNMFVTLLTLKFAFDGLTSAPWWAILLVVVTFTGVLLPVAVLSVLQPTCQLCHEDIYRVPLVPFIPSLSILINLALMAAVDYLVWLRLLIWIAIGTLLYSFYSINHSKENDPDSDQLFPDVNITPATSQEDIPTDISSEE